MTSGRGTFEDPILERIAAADPGEFERCVMALAQLGTPAALALANCDALPEVAMTALAEDATPGVRAAVARHPSCPARILERLATDGDPDVRRSVAAHASTTPDVLLAIVAQARHQWEWRSLWEPGLQTRYPDGSVWPSTHAFQTAESPKWLLDTLARYGHPAALIHIGIEAQPPTVEAWLALRDLINSELLVRALWRELALAGAVTLVYLNDSVGGDNFFPQAEGLTLMEDGTAAECLIGGYSEAREWIELEDTLETSSALRLAAGLFEERIDTQINEFDSETLALFALAGVAWAADVSEDSIPVGRLVDLAEAALPNELGEVPIRWTERGEAAIEEILRPIVEHLAEHDDLDPTVTVVGSRLPGIGYAATTDAQKAWLTELLRQARSNPMVTTWGLSDHFLMCVALHPATPEDLRDQLLMDSSEQVRHAARKFMDPGA